MRPFFNHESHETDQRLTPLSFSIRVISGGSTSALCFCGKSSCPASFIARFSFISRIALIDISSCRGMPENSHVKRLYRSCDVAKLRELRWFFTVHCSPFHSVHIVPCRPHRSTRSQAQWNETIRRPPTVPEARSRGPRFRLLSLFTIYYAPVRVGPRRSARSIPFHAVTSAVERNDSPPTAHRLIPSHTVSHGERAQ